MAALMSALLVVGTARWWGVTVTWRQRLWAAGLTLGLASLTGLAAVKQPQDAWWFAPMIALLAIVAVVDFAHQVIPNRLVILSAVWALAARWHYGHWLDALAMAAAVFAFYLAINVLTRGGLGMGDVKFSGVLALALGYPDGLVSVVAGLWAAGGYALFLIVTRRRQRGDLMALGPFLALGGLIGLIVMLRG